MIIFVCMAVGFLYSFITSSILTPQNYSRRFFFLIFVTYLQFYNKFSQVNDSCLGRSREEYVL